MPEAFTILAGGVRLPAAPGDTILSAMRAAGGMLHSICGGRGMCGTCRVAVAQDWLDRLAPPAFSELRLLRVLKEAAPHHRLACQTVLDERHDGLSFEADPPLSKVLNPSS